MTTILLLLLSTSPLESRCSYVETPEDLLAREVRRGPVVKITGDIVDENNAPLANAMVAPSHNPDNRRTFTDASGHFTLEVRANEKSLFIWKKGFVSRDLEGTERPMRIVMKRRPTLAVYLLEVGGQPMRGIQKVEAFDALGKRVGECGTRDVEGDCTLEVELGIITVTATAHGRAVTQMIRVEDNKKRDLTLRF